MNEHHHGYRLPGDPANPGSTPNPADVRHHEHDQKRARRADREALAQRTAAPGRPTLTAPQLGKLRTLARQLFELELRNRALSASTNTALRFRERCQQQLRALEPDVDRARGLAQRTTGTSSHNRNAQDLAALEARVARLRDDIAEAMREIAAIAAERSPLVAITAPLRTTIEKICARVSATRADLGIDLGLPELQRLGSDVVVTR